MVAADPLELRLREIFPEAVDAKVDQVAMLSDIQREPLWQHLRSLRCQVEWVGAPQLDELRAQGWQPAIERRYEGMYLFLDRSKTRVLMYRAPADDLAAAKPAEPTPGEGSKI